MKKLLLVTAATLAFTVPALADTFFQADSFSVVGGGVAVHITNTVPAANENVLAGQVSLHNNATNTDLLVWCLDIFDGINLPYNYTVSTYNAGDARPGMATLDGSQLRQIAGLMLLGQGAVSDAAVQLAIWKTEYGATFDTPGLSGTLLTQMNFALANSVVGGSLDCANCTLTVLSDAPIQPSQAFGFASVAVPGPIVGAGLPGILAMFGMGGWAWRRRKVAA